MHVLLIEDDYDLGRSLQRSLQFESITSEWLQTAVAARRFVERSDAAYDCILLDLALPDGLGRDLLRAWRRAGIATPVIVITANVALDERVASLDGGADDFVPKPFAVRELVSRMHAVLRRSHGQADGEWSVGPIRIDPRRHEVRVDGAAVELSPREYQLLLELARAGGAVVSKDRLALRLAPLGDPVDFNAIEVHVHNLRRKIGAASIRTVRGIGYRLEEGVAN